MLCSSFSSTSPPELPPDGRSLTLALRSGAFGLGRHIGGIELVVDLLLLVDHRDGEGCGTIDGNGEKAKA